MRRLLQLALVVVLPAAPLRAQDATRSPHGSLAEACADCHAADRWSPARIGRFDHARAGFALTGAHARTACRDCHATLDFRNTPSTCSACHTDVHRSELGADCVQCHTTRSFLDRATMTRAHQLTRFPLTGTHLAVDCESCHPPAAQGSLRFVNRPSECVQCHGEAYRLAKEPDHLAGGFPTACDQCHSTASWPGARFNHAATRFPLTGAHRAVTCQECHGDGVRAGTPTACVACHQAAYDETTDPNHRSAGFPTACSDCHTTSTWDGAAFDHDASFFPIYSGRHRGEWTSCSTCHTTPSSFQAFTCLSCHQHSRPETDGHHDGVNGYRYDSQACYSCHPRGDED
jgi:RecJ-like exonuclease